MRPVLNTAQRSLVAVVRGAYAAQWSAPAEAVWRIADGFGVVELAIPAKQGGIGLEVLDWCLVAEELGARLGDPALIWQLLGYAETHCARGSDEEREAAAHTLRAVAGDGSGAVGRLSRGAVPAQFAQQAEDLEQVRHAAYTVGVGRRALELARERAARRVVGGTALIERQAVAHRVARAAFALQSARFEVYQAAWALEHTEAGSHLALTALAAAGRAAVGAAHDAVQIFGAAGTSRADVVAVYRAAYRAATAYGSPDRLWRAAADRRYRTAGAGP